MGWIGLRDYQREAVDKMKTGCILCGGVGSGKSRTAIAYYYAKNEGDLEAETYVQWLIHQKTCTSSQHPENVIRWNGSMSLHHFCYLCMKMSTYIPIR